MLRIRRVGALSLASLVVGGVMLILFARNVGSSDASNIFNQRTKDSRQGVFRFGSQLSIQSWLAILGATFGLLSHGLAATHTHLFDSWSSWRATRCDEDPGLDYACYLNTQAQAPVMLGFFHGFSFFVLLRYVVVALCIAASVGYKFAVVEVTYEGYEAIHVDQVQLRLPPLRGIENGTTSPWVSDDPMLDRNRAFIHEVSYGEESALRAPRAITMVGLANCSGVFHALDSGTLLTREVVMIATEEGTSYGRANVTSNPGEWMRAESSTAGWFNESSERAVIDYRIAEPGTVQIQWARRGSWADDGSGTQQQRIEWRVTYRIRYAVVEVPRWVENSSCSHVFEYSSHLLAESELPIRTQSANGSVPINDRLLAGLLYTGGTGPRDGISAILRGIMAGWGAQTAETGPHDDIPPLGHAPDNHEPFGKERTESAYRTRHAKSRVEYPFYKGERAGKQTGSYYAAAEAFMGIGITAIVIALARVAIGPPLLTSWMGQHVTIAMVGADIGSDRREAAEELTSGYQAADEKLGDLRLVTTEGRIKFQFVEHNSRVSFLPGDMGVGSWNRSA
jgi:hypothetical protein